MIECADGGAVWRVNAAGSARRGPTHPRQRSLRRSSTPRPPIGAGFGATGSSERAPQPGPSRCTSARCSSSTRSPTAAPAPSPPALATAGPTSGRGTRLPSAIACAAAGLPAGSRTDRPVPARPRARAGGTLPRRRQPRPRPGGPGRRDRLGRRRREGGRASAAAPARRRPSSPAANPSPGATAPTTGREGPATTSATPSPPHPPTCLSSRIYMTPQLRHPLGAGAGAGGWASRSRVWIRRLLGRCGRSPRRASIPAVARDLEPPHVPGDHVRHHARRRLGRWRGPLVAPRRPGSPGHSLRSASAGRRCG